MIVRPSEAKRYGAVSGIGAGAGAALAMMVAMLALRFGVGVPSIPELMLGPILRLMGGQAFSAALDTLYYAGRPLLFALVLEGTLLLGALLGLLYAWLGRPTPYTRHRPLLFRSPLGGILYGLIIGVLLNTVFLPLMGEAPFAVRSGEVYSNTSAPLWLALMVLALVYGTTLHRLLPDYASGKAPISSAPGEAGALGYISPAMDRRHDRRQFLRIAGGGLLALAGGALFWYGGTVLNQRGFTSPVDAPAPDDSAALPGSTASGSDVASAIDTPSAEITPTQYPPTEIPPAQRQTEVLAPTDTPTARLDADATTASTPIVEPAAPTAAPSAVQPTVTSQPPAPTATTAPPPPTSTGTPQVAQATATPAVPRPVPIGVREITPVGSFYRVSKNFFDPSPSADNWTLSIKGLVANSYSLSYKQLTAMPAATATVGMMCISNPIGGGLIGNQTWKGVRLADLLKRAKPQANAVDLLLTAADGYTDSIPLSKALDPDVMLVWEMAGAPLTSEHGGPARLLVPGIYGMKHVKWLTTIELVGYDFRGYWQQPDQGWSDPAPVNTMSRIDSPAGSTVARRAQVVSGIAFAGDRSISKVEVSTDGGKTWNAAYVKPPLSSTSWAVWGYEWTPPAAGKYVLQVRATDGYGNLQTSRRTDPYPNGATGYHMVTVMVSG